MLRNIREEILITKWFVVLWMSKKFKNIVPECYYINDNKSKRKISMQILSYGLTRKIQCNKRKWRFTPWYLKLLNLESINTFYYFSTHWNSYKISNVQLANESSGKSRFPFFIGQIGELIHSLAIWEFSLLVLLVVLLYLDYVLLVNFETFGIFFRLIIFFVFFLVFRITQVTFCEYLK